MPKSKHRKNRRRRSGPTRSKSPVAPVKHKESSIVYQVVMFALMGLGLLLILANYIGLVPGGTDNRFLAFGLGGIAVGFGMTLWYH